MGQLAHSQATTLRRCNLACGGVVQKLAKTHAEGVLPILPPDLHTRTVEKPEYVVAVPDPEVVVDHARLVLKEYIFKTTEQADSQVAKLRELIFSQVIRIYHSDPKDSGKLFVAANDSRHFCERRSRQMISLRVRRLHASLDLHRQVNNR